MKTVIRSNLYYLGTVKVNLIGYWRKGLSKPFSGLLVLRKHVY
jgi:hypothetical protein